MDIFQRRSEWRKNVNHDSPKAKKIRQAVKDLHERGQYPGMQRVMNEIGDPLYRSRPVEPEFLIDGKPLTISTRRWMSGRDNAVRKRAMRELGIEVEKHPWADWD